jgi:hypothetical protein
LFIFIWTALINNYVRGIFFKEEGFFVALFHVLIFGICIGIDLFMKHQFLILIILLREDNLCLHVVQLWAR